MPALVANCQGTGHQTVPSWINADRENLRANIVSNPQRQEIALPIQEQLVVELYSK